MEIEIAVCVVILLAMVFLATVDMAFSQLSDLSLRRLSSEADETAHPRSTRILREILENRARFRFALSSTIQFLLISFTVLVTVIVLGFTTDPATLIISALLIGIIATVFFRQILPRLIVRGKPEAVLLFLLPVVMPVFRIGAFFAGPFDRFFIAREQQKLNATTTPDSSDEKDDDNADDFQALMEVGEAEGILEEDQRELIESMVEFNETRAGEIMTPRTEICGLPVNSTIKQARDLIIDQKYSRLPVYRDSIDNVEGVIYVRDLMQAWADGREDEPVASVVRDAYFVPETKSASDLLKSMQASHVQLAIVIDEYGGVAGILTVEDIIEEIFGEIEDEDSEDEEIVEIIEGTDGYFDMLGSTDIDKIERLFGIDIEDEDFTTVAGLVTSEAGYVPKVGEKLELRGLEFEILRADEKKLAMLRVRKANSPDADNRHTTAA
ncbi:MAG: hemolysin family protein [Acidobacteriota bacterium]